MKQRGSCRKDTGILLWTRDCKPNRTTERRMLLTSLDKTDIDMQNRHNLGFSERKRSVDKEWCYKQEVTSCADSPSRELFKSSNLKRPLAKELTNDFAPMRMNKLVPHLPAKCIDGPRFLRNTDRRSIQDSQDEMALLNQGAVRGKLSQEQKCLEIELDEALASMHTVTTERNSLAEQLRISQEQAKSEQMYLTQRVKDLQTTILKLDEERCDLNRRQSVKDGQMVDLEKQIHAYSCKLGMAEEQLKKSQSECSSLRELQTKSENAVSDLENKLQTKARELENVLERNEQLEQKSDSLFEQLNDMRNGLYNLQAMTFQLSHGKEALQDELEKKDKLIGHLNTKIEKLETSVKSLHQDVNRGNRELEAMQEKAADTKEQLNSALREKDAMLQADADLQDELDKVHLDNLSLQRKVEGSSQEMELLQRKLQDFLTESSTSKMLLSSKEEVIEKLKFAIKELEISVRGLKQEVNRANGELDATQRKLTDKDQQLNAVTREKEALLKANADLQDDRYRTKADSQAVGCRVEGSSQDVELLQRKLQDCMMEKSQMEMLLWSKEDIIEDLELTVSELETSAKALQQEVSRGDRELDAMQRKLSGRKRQLNGVTREKGALLDGNADLQGGHYRVQRLNQEEAIEALNLKIQELETSTKSLQAALCERDCELDNMRKKAANAEKDLDSVEKEKEAIVQAKAVLQNDLNKVQLDNQALQRKVEGSNQDGLQKKLQECVTESSYLKILLSSKEDVIEHLQVTVKELRTKSLKQETNKDSGELDAVQGKLRRVTENLNTVLKEKEVVLQENASLKDALAKVQLENQALQRQKEGSSPKALQRKVEGANQEVELLRKTLQDYMTESTHAKILLSSMEDVNECMHLRIQELEASAKSLQQAVSERGGELEAVQKKLTDTEQKLDFAAMEKKAMLQANNRVRIDFDKLQLDNESLQRKVEGSSQEMELLQRKLQEHATEISQNNILLSSKEEAITSLQLTVMKLETSAKNAQLEVGKGTCDLQRKLSSTEENLPSVASEEDSVLKASADLCDTLEKLDDQVREKVALQNKVEGSSQEVELLLKKLQDCTSKISCMNEQLSLKEEVIENLQLTIKELETSVKNLQQSSNRAQKELEFARKRVSNTEEILSALMKEKEATEKENLDLRDELYSVQSGNQALQRKMEGSSQEVELLQMELQDFSTDVNILQSWVSSSEAAIARLLKTFEGLEPSVESLQQEQNAGGVDSDASGLERKTADAKPGALVQQDTQRTSSKS